METQQSELKKGNRILWLALFAIAVAVLYFKSCSNSNGTVIVNHPAVSGKTDIVKPESVPIINGAQTSAKSSVFLDKNSNNTNKNKGLHIALKDYNIWKVKADSLLAENEKLKNAFSRETDKKKLDSLYQKAIEINAFTHTWDNDTLKATVNGLSRGIVQDIQLHYTIKATKQEIKVPETKFRLLGGFETGATKDLSKMNFKANLGLQNAKGNILSAGYDSEQRIYVGYQISIFSIKR